MPKIIGSNTVQIKRAPLVIDPRDNSLYRDWGNATLTTVNGCMIEPFPMAEKLNIEDNRDREFSKSAVRVYCPIGTDVVYTDRILAEDHEWQVLGHPGKWYDLKGNIKYIAVIAVIKQG